VTCDGRLFHRRAAVTGNALSPTVDRRVRRTRSSKYVHIEFLVETNSPIRFYWLKTSTSEYRCRDRLGALNASFLTIGVRANFSRGSEPSLPEIFFPAKMAKFFVCFAHWRFATRMCYINSLLTRIHIDKCSVTYLFIGWSWFGRLSIYRKTSSKRSRRLLEHGPQNPGV